MTKNSPWKGVNKCVVCGTKLKFEPSKDKDAKPDEGTRYCEQNHARFNVYGKFHDDLWVLTFALPVKIHRT